MFEMLLVLIITVFIQINIVDLYSVNGRVGRQVRSPWTEELYPRVNSDFLERRLSHQFNTETDGQTYRAITFGRGHVITFDGTYIHYHIPDGLSSPRCAHILARDRVELSFTIVHNSDRIILYSPHAVFTLHNNNKVEVNNTEIYKELPLQTWDNSVSVTRDNRAVVIQTTTGILISCDLHHSVCLYQLKDNYSNHTTGLLGTNDNDATNDLLMRSGQVTRYTQEFVNNYELTGRTECRPVTSGGESCESHMVYRCRHLFVDDSSPLADCYNTVNSHPYKLACEYDVGRCHNMNKDNSVCEAVQAYVKVCHTYGIHVALPSECAGRCHHHRIGSAWIEQTHKKLDIVIVTSLNAELLPGDTLAGTIYDMMHSIEVYLKQHSGVHNVRVGLLAYGGNGYLDKPHVYTVQGESFTRHYSSALWREVLQSLDTDGLTNTDPIQALQTALDFPYRQSAVKMLLFITEQPCTANIPASLTSQLESSGIILNIFTQAQQIHQTHCARDSIMDLVEYSHGAVFDVDDISARDELTLQHVCQEIHREMISSMYQCRHCTCQVSSSGSATSTCRLNVCD